MPYLWSFRMYLPSVYVLILLVIYIFYSKFHLCIFERLVFLSFTKKRQAVMFHNLYLKACLPIFLSEFPIITGSLGQQLEPIKGKIIIYNMLNSLTLLQSYSDQFEFGYFIRNYFQKNTLLQTQTFGIFFPVHNFIALN